MDRLCAILPMIAHLADCNLRLLRLFLLSSHVDDLQEGVHWCFVVFCLSFGSLLSCKLRPQTLLVLVPDHRFELVLLLALQPHSSDNRQLELVLDSQFLVVFVVRT
jgi:hypothetical protein